MNIYVGALSSRATEHDLRTSFEAHGEVESADIVNFEARGKSKPNGNAADHNAGLTRRCGFVTMPDDAQARKAIAAVNGGTIAGGAVVVNEAKKKRTALRGIVGALLLILPCMWGFADGYEARSVEISPYVGWNFPDPGCCFEDGPLYGLRVGYFFVDSFSAEIEANVSPSGIENMPIDATIFNYRASGLFNFNGDKWIPYLKLGAGQMSVDVDGRKTENDFAVSGGGGVRYLFNRHWGLRGEALRVYGDEVDTVELSAGLTFGFWGRHAEPVESDRDSDGDGVYNRTDQCPDTPRGAWVDSYGCPKDSDGDGVLDGLDKCPDTPKGAWVDTFGCPKDSDGDGVLDGLDKCPDTPRGARVDSQGCPLDGDKDRVYDGLDKCPDSTLNAKVDADGCEKVAAAVRVIYIDNFHEANVGETIVLEDLYFESDKNNIDDTDALILNRLAKVLKEHPSMTIAVSGHTDSQASNAYNLRLSDRRAKAVNDYLVQHGVDAYRVESRGYGEEMPRDTNDTPGGRARNRRVEVTRTK